MTGKYKGTHRAKKGVACGLFFIAAVALAVTMGVYGVSAWIA